MTQEQPGDATGMTSVHVYRTLKALAKDGVIDPSGRWIAIQDWNKIRQEGDFNPLYLHLDQVAPHPPGPLSYRRRYENLRDYRSQRPEGKLGIYRPDRMRAHRLTGSRA